MCARYTLRTPLTVLIEEFQLQLPGILSDFAPRPRFNVAPTQDVIGVRAEHSQERQLALFHWGLIPSWSRDEKIARSTINARGETVATKPAFRAAVKKRRCLVLADGYYEWKTEGKKKIPYLYEIDGGKPFAFAGLWETWYGPKDEPERAALESCTILTTDPNELASELHDRMPVVLDAADYDRWLDPTVQKFEEVESLVAPFPTERMTATRLGTYVNNARHEGEQCLEVDEE